MGLLNEKRGPCTEKDPSLTVLIHESLLDLVNFSLTSILLLFLHMHDYVCSLHVPHLIMYVFLLL